MSHPDMVVDIYKVEGVNFSAPQKGGVCVGGGIREEKKNFDETSVWRRKSKTE